MKKKGQVGIEYMIIVGFVSFAVIAILLLAFFYSGQIKDSIKLNQAENFAEQLIGSAESVFFAGEPSKTTIRLYLPENVESIDINNNYVTVTMQLSTGQNIRSYETKVPLQGTITTSEGIKKLTLIATEDNVVITQS
jgi:hypothetical protein